MTILVYLLLVFGLVKMGAAGKTDKAALEERIKSLEGALQRTKDELNDVYRKLETKPDSVLGQAMNSLGSCFTSPPEKTFKPFVSEVLKILDVKDETLSKSEITVSLSFSSSSKDLQTLRRFVLYDDIRFHEVQDILLSSISKLPAGVGGGLFDLDTILAGAGGKIHPQTVQLLLAGLMVCVVLVPLCLGVKKRAVVLLLTCICLVHVWLGEYWKVVAKKEATLAKLGPNMKSCRLEKRGYAHAVSEFFSGLFNGVSDPCEEYYRAAMVDPIFEVNMIHAIVESLSQMMGILGGFGHAVGNFFNNFLVPLPLAWKIPGLVILIVLAMVFSGYQIKTLFFTIGPSENRSSKTKSVINKSKKALKNATQDTDEMSSNDELENHGDIRKMKMLPSTTSFAGGFAIPDSRN